MSFEEFWKIVELDLSFDNGLVMSGPAPKILEYYTGEGQTIAVSTWQPIMIRDIVNKYIKQNGYALTDLTKDWFKENV